MKALEIPFEEKQVLFGDEAAWSDYRDICPAGLVPSLVDGDTVVWDSLAIVEYLAESYADIWPADKAARAWARCASAEMHSGFTALRNECAMNCGVKVRLHEMSADLTNDIKRIEQLWLEGLARFNGPFLTGDKFTAVDAFFAPVVFRINSYGHQVHSIGQDYMQQILAVESIQEWYRAAINETSRISSYEDAILNSGRILEDVRVKA